MSRIVELQDCLTASKEALKLQWPALSATSALWTHARHAPEDSTVAFRRGLLRLALWLAVRACPR